MGLWKLKMGDDVQGMIIHSGQHFFRSIKNTKAKLAEFYRDWYCLGRLNTIVPRQGFILWLVLIGRS